MNQHYLNRYYKFINSLKNQTVDGYFEKHHIVPRSHGGSNDKENLIKLTARQHYVAHWMLWKAYGKEMTTAFHYMTHVGRYGKRINSRTFELLKLEEDARNRSRKHTPEAIEKNRQAHLGKKITEEHKKAISKALKGKPKSRLPDVSIEKMKATKKQRFVPKIWVNNGDIQTKITYNKIEEYLNNGWERGFLRKYIVKRYKNLEKIYNESV